jgi:pyruvate ferredoxin oxidoreductase delta subunit
MADKTWKDILPGGIVDTPGSAREYRTGDWRSQRPVYDPERCVHCGVCYLYCPDMAIRMKEDGTIDINNFYCKGCGICSAECPTGAFKMITEAEGKKMDEQQEAKHG